MITKHYCKSIVRAALLLALTMCITGLAPAFSSSARADFSINDVSGNYVWHSEGWAVGQGNSDKIVPVSDVGLVTFTPATGTFHADWIVRTEGENGEAIHDGTYTVDANGHGTMSRAGHHRDFYVLNGGAEVKWTNTDGSDAFPPVAASTGIITKQ